MARQFGGFSFLEYLGAGNVVTATVQFKEVG